MAGHQPDYLPWLGYFDKIRRCDVFVIEDIMQFEYHGFRNRNRFKTRDGVVWLTVPVRHATRWQAIRDVEIANDLKRRWARRHWGTLQTNYGKAPYFKEFREFFRLTYERPWYRLIDLNLHLIKGVMDFMKIVRRLVMASSLGVSGKKNDLLIAQCKALGADVYLSGAGGRAYVDVQKFRDEGIEVMFQDFGYPVYEQLHGEFVSDLSVVDYLFNVGAIDWSIDHHMKSNANVRA